MTRLIAILLCNRMRLADVLALVDCFQAANQVVGHAAYTITTCAVAGGLVPDSGTWIGFSAAYNLNNLPQAPDTLIIPNGAPIDLNDHDLRLVDFLTRRAPGIRRVAAIGNGLLFCAAAGLTRGITVAADQEAAARLATLCSDTTVDPTAEWFRSGSLWSGIGKASSARLALSFVEEDLGLEIAEAVAERVGIKTGDGDVHLTARGLISGYRRDGSVVERIQDWVRANPAADLSVGTLARHVAMSEKTLSRTFKQKTGQTLGDFVLNIRLGYACDMLTGGERKIKDIARLSGLGSQTNMRQLFISRFGQTPSDYRNRPSGGDAGDAGKASLDEETPSRHLSLATADGSWF